MVVKYGKNGWAWKEPPYTKAQIAEFYRRRDEGVSMGLDAVHSP